MSRINSVYWLIDWWSCVIRAVCLHPLMKANCGPFVCTLFVPVLFALQSSMSYQVMNGCGVIRHEAVWGCVTIDQSMGSINWLHSNSLLCIGCNYLGGMFLFCYFHDLFCSQLSTITVQQIIHDWYQEVGKRVLILYNVGKGTLAVHNTFTIYSLGFVQKPLN